MVESADIVVVVQRSDDEATLRAAHERQVGRVLSLHVSEGHDYRVDVPALSFVNHAVPRNYAELEHVVLAAATVLSEGGWLLEAQRQCILRGLTHFVHIDREGGIRVSLTQKGGSKTKSAMLVDQLVRSVDGSVSRTTAEGIFPTRDKRFFSRLSHDTNQMVGAELVQKLADGRFSLRPGWEVARPRKTPRLSDQKTSGYLYLPAEFPIPASAAQLVDPWFRAMKFVERPASSVLRSWCQSSEQSLSLLLLHGEQGAGKTRLLIELCRELRALDWTAGFLPCEGETRRVTEFGSHSLVVVDDACTRLSDVRALLSNLGQTRSDSIVRVLLIDRTDDWWESWRSTVSARFEVSTSEALLVGRLGKQAAHDASGSALEASQRFLPGKAVLGRERSSERNPLCIALASISLREDFLEAVDSVVEGEMERIRVTIIAAGHRGGEASALFEVLRQCLAVALVYPAMSHRELGSLIERLAPDIRIRSSVRQVLPPASSLLWIRPVTVRYLRQVFREFPGLVRSLMASPGALTPSAVAVLRFGAIMVYQAEGMGLLADMVALELPVALKGGTSGSRFPEKELHLNLHCALVDAAKDMESRDDVSWEEVWNVMIALATGWARLSDTDRLLEALERGLAACRLYEGETETPSLGLEEVHALFALAYDSQGRDGRARRSDRRAQSARMRRVAWEEESGSEILTVVDPDSLLARVERVAEGAEHVDEVLSLLRDWKERPTFRGRARLRLLKLEAEVLLRSQQLRRAVAVTKTLVAEARALTRGFDESRDLLGALRVQAKAHEALGEFELAAEALEQSIVILETRVAGGSKYAASRLLPVLFFLADARRRAGQHTHSLVIARRGVAFGREHGLTDVAQLRIVAACHELTALVAYELGHGVEAVDAQRQCVALFRALVHQNSSRADLNSLGVSLRGLVAYMVRFGVLEDASGFADEAISVSLELMQRMPGRAAERGVAKAHILAARVCSRLGEDEAVLEVLDRILQTGTEVFGNLHPNPYRLKAEALEHLGSHLEARAPAARAFETCLEAWLDDDTPDSLHELRQTLLLVLRVHGRWKAVDVLRDVQVVVPVQHPDAHLVKGVAGGALLLMHIRLLNPDDSRPGWISSMGRMIQRAAHQSLRAFHVWRRFWA